MKKAELIERIVDAMIDPWNDCPEDYLDATPIDIYGAADLLCQLRADEVSADLENDERLPAEVTPALVMEAYNCIVRSRKHEAWVNRLAQYIADTDQTCLYDNYYGRPEGVPEVIPTDLLYNTYHLKSLPFDCGHPVDAIMLIQIAQNSSEFGINSEYFYYDAQHNALVSVDNPFKEGIYDAREFAEFILSPDGRECLEYLVNDCMTEDDVEDVFRCTSKEVLA